MLNVAEEVERLLGAEKKPRDPAAVAAGLRATTARITPPGLTYPQKTLESIKQLFSAPPGMKDVNDLMPVKAAREIGGGIRQGNLKPLAETAAGVPAGLWDMSQDAVGGLAKLAPGQSGEGVYQSAQRNKRLDDELRQWMGLNPESSASQFGQAGGSLLPAVIASRFGAKGPLGTAPFYMSSNVGSQEAVSRERRGHGQSAGEAAVSAGIGGSESMPWLGNLGGRITANALVRGAGEATQEGFAALANPAALNLPVEKQEFYDALATGGVLGTMMGALTPGQPRIRTQRQGPPLPPGSAEPVQPNGGEGGTSSSLPSPSPADPLGMNRIPYLRMEAMHRQQRWNDLGFPGSPPIDWQPTPTNAQLNGQAPPLPPTTPPPRPPLAPTGPSLVPPERRLPPPRVPQAHPSTGGADFYVEPGSGDINANLAARRRLESIRQQLAGEPKRLPPFMPVREVPAGAPTNVPPSGAPAGRLPTQAPPAPAPQRKTEIPLTGFSSEGGWIMDEALSKQYGKQVFRGHLRPDEIKEAGETYQHRRKGQTDSGDTGNLALATQVDSSALFPIFVHAVPNAQTGKTDYFTADGHNRMALVRRTKYNEPIDVVILRQEDGWSAADARKLGAMRNVTQGTADEVDTAIAWKDASEAEREQMLARSGSVVARNGIKLAGLKPGAWDRFIAHGEAVKGSNAALIPDAIPDETRQIAALDQMVKRSPQTENDALAIIFTARSLGDAELDNAQGNLINIEYTPAMERRENIVKEALRQISERSRSGRAVKTLGGRMESEGLAQNTNAALGKQVVNEAAEAKKTFSSNVGFTGPLQEALKRIGESDASIKDAAAQLIEEAAKLNMSGELKSEIQPPPGAPPAPPAPEGGGGAGDPFSPDSNPPFNETFYPPEPAEPGAPPKTRMRQLMEQHEQHTADLAGHIPSSNLYAVHSSHIKEIERMLDMSAQEIKEHLAAMRSHPANNPPPSNRPASKLPTPDIKREIIPTPMPRREAGRLAGEHTSKLPFPGTQSHLEDFTQGASDQPPSNRPASKLPTQTTTSQKFDKDIHEMELISKEAAEIQSRPRGVENEYSKASEGELVKLQKQAESIRRRMERELGHQDEGAFHPAYNKASFFYDKIRAVIREAQDIRRELDERLARARQEGMTKPAPPPPANDKIARLEARLAERKKVFDALRRKPISEFTEADAKANDLYYKTKRELDEARAAAGETEQQDDGHNWAPSRPRMPGGRSIVPAALNAIGPASLAKGAVKEGYDSSRFSIILHYNPDKPFAWTAEQTHPKREKRQSIRAKTAAGLADNIRRHISPYDEDLDVNIVGLSGEQVTAKRGYWITALKAVLRKESENLEAGHKPLSLQTGKERDETLRQMRDETKGVIPGEEGGGPRFIPQGKTEADAMEADLALWKRIKVAVWQAHGHKPDDPLRGIDRDKMIEQARKELWLRHDEEWNGTHVNDLEAMDRWDTGTPVGWQENGSAWGRRETDAMNELDGEVAKMMAGRRNMPPLQRQLQTIIDRLRATAGYRMERDAVSYTSRNVLLGDLKSIKAMLKPEEYKTIERVIKGIKSTAGAFPRLRYAGNPRLPHALATFNKQTGVEVSENTFDSENSGPIMPPHITITHEISHFVWELMTNEQRAEFLEIVRDRYYKDGRINEQAMKDDTMPKGYQGGNATYDFNELFAWLSQRYLYQKHAPRSAKEKTFWEKMRAYAEAVWDFFTNRPVPQEFKPFFDSVFGAPTMDGAVKQQMEAAKNWWKGRGDNETKAVIPFVEKTTGKVKWDAVRDARPTAEVWEALGTALEQSPEAQSIPRKLAHALGIGYYTTKTLGENDSGNPVLTTYDFLANRIKRRFAVPEGASKANLFGATYDAISQVFANNLIGRSKAGAFEGQRPELADAIKYRIFNMEGGSPEAHAFLEDNLTARERRALDAATASLTQITEAIRAQGGDLAVERALTGNPRFQNFGKMTEGVMNTIGRAVNAVHQGLFNSFLGVQKAGRQIGGRDYADKLDAMRARFTLSPRALNETLNGSGAPVYDRKSGTFRVGDDSISLADVLAPANKLPLQRAEAVLANLSVYLRRKDEVPVPKKKTEEGIVYYDRHDPVYRAQIESIERELDGNPDREMILEMEKGVRKFLDDHLRLLRQAGEIGPVTQSRWKAEHPYYVPGYHRNHEFVNSYLPRTRNAETRITVVEALALYSNFVIRKSYENSLLREISKMAAMKDGGQFMQKLGNPRAEGFKLGNTGIDRQGSMLRVNNGDGVDIFQIDSNQRLLMGALHSLTPKERRHLLWRISRGLGRMQQTLVASVPDFQIKVFLQEMPHNMLNTRHPSWHPRLDPRGLGVVLNARRNPRALTREQRDLLLNGLPLGAITPLGNPGGVLDPLSRFDPHASIRPLASRKGAVEAAARTLEGLRSPEGVSRLPLANERLKAGDNSLMAAYAATSSADFTKTGDWLPIQWASETIPFFNSALAGLRAFSRNLLDEMPRLAAKKAKGGTLDADEAANLRNWTIAATILGALGTAILDEEEDNPLIESMPRADRDRYLFISSLTPYGEELMAEHGEIPKGLSLHEYERIYDIKRLSGGWEAGSFGVLVGASIKGMRDLAAGKEGAGEKWRENSLRALRKFGRDWTRVESPAVNLALQAFGKADLPQPHGKPENSKLPPAHQEGRSYAGTQIGQWIARMEREITGTGVVTAPRIEAFWAGTLGVGPVKLAGDLLDDAFRGRIDLASPDAAWETGKRIAGRTLKGTSNPLSNRYGEADREELYDTESGVRAGTQARAMWQKARRQIATDANPAQAWENLPEDLRAGAMTGRAYQKAQSRLGEMNSGVLLLNAAVDEGIKNGDWRQVHEGIDGLRQVEAELLYAISQVKGRGRPQNPAVLTGEQVRALIDSKDAPGVRAAQERAFDRIGDLKDELELFIFGQIETEVEREMAR